MNDQIDSGRPWGLVHGATVMPDGQVRFSVWAPKAKEVTVSVSGERGKREAALTSSGSGVFSVVLDDVPTDTDYYYRLDGGPPRPDPVSRSRPKGVDGPTRIVDPTGFSWTDDSWRGLPTSELVIYELHIGTFTGAGSFDSAAEQLPRLRELGVTAIEIMPVAEFPGGRNWGYDGVSLYAPQSTYGGPTGLKRLVNACHQQGLAAILDVVYNHLGPRGNYLPEFGPYLSERHRTAWGESWNLDGPESDEVRAYLVGNALYWITEFHFDGLRLDAADKIVDQSAFHILEEIVSRVRALERVLGRQINLIAESDANDPRYIETSDQGGYGLDAQWTDDFHHAVHVALTEERQGCFQDFGGISPIAKVLTSRFVHDGRYSPFRRRRYGRPASHLPSDRFVVCIQNHDQVGNRALGERLSQLLPPESLRLAAAVLLLSPYVPMLFMGEEYGELNPFFYFVSHGDPDLVRAVREGRRRELGALDSAIEIPDPEAEETFRRSRLDWDRAASPAHAKLRRLYADLLLLRRRERALRPGIARVSVSYDESAGWIRLELTAPKSSLQAGFNFARYSQAIPLSGSSEIILYTDDPQYGGSGTPRLAGGQVTLAPLSAAVLRDELA
jgi:maltooligosyltrehalose trehalohydrolase